LDEATIAELLRDAARYEVFIGEGNEITARDRARRPAPAAA
jgi:hypothetical protein